MVLAEWIAPDLLSEVSPFLVFDFWDSAAAQISFLWDTDRTIKECLFHF